LSSQEGTEAVGVPTGALRGQVEWACGFEALWDESSGLLPLQRVVMEPIHVDNDWVVLADGKLASFKVFTHSHGGGDEDGRHHAQRLIETVLIERQV